MAEMKSNIKLYILGFLAFFVSLIQNIYTPIIPRLHDDFHVSLFWINVTVGGFIFIVAIMQILLGKSIDSRDSKKVLLAGLGIVILSSFVCAITNNFILFAISRLVQAIGCGIIPLVTLTLLAKLSSGNGRASAMANYQIFLSCAPALAPILGSSIGAKWDYMGIFSFLFAISMILFLIISFTNIPNVEKGIGKLTEKVNENYLSDKVFITLVLLGFLIFFTYFSILVYLPTLLNNIYNIGEGISGVLFLPITVSVILGSMFYKRISKKHEGLIILKYTVIIFSIFTLLFGLFNTLSLIILSFIIFILGLFVGLVPALLSTLISQRFESIKGKVLGVFNFVRYIGMTIGAILIGLVPQTFMPYYFASVSLVLISIFIYANTEIFKEMFNNKK
ncbi:MFS transporter [Staphylococcus sp. HMSC077C04]|nr:MFS transporter [Staphylococcus lugdunensis]EHS04240.1 transporter, major facilitator family protein [Staphylococcus lugdunensis VCU139]EVI53038.1 drug transporter [Staphylococcus lugdunensis UCIM6116]KAK62446.1 transporter, major facilitator family protein [Staphylococcus lugdunensis VCU148]OFN88556.1 MFS transporter [Staphylococcus sp. HMSC077C04]OFP68244.1 MFS transporter [Staphylococcus sp. HMSC068G03]OFQ34754.1 MFS transporter [Staphylococcus sp. HMSC073C12]OHO83388.1 MFS transporter